MTPTPISDATLVEVALFPIPEMVSFPGTTVPLHVFEPRYRALIRDCVRDQRMIAVCHTEKQISPTKPNQDLSDMLKTNQASFEPCQVFSAGVCEVVETTEDGRLRVDVKMQGRYKLKEYQQMVPYRIVNCEPVDDIELDPAQTDDASQLMKSINEILVSIIDTQNPDIKEFHQLTDWLDLSPAEYSFRVFSLFRFEAEIMQEVLETLDPYQRLKMINNIFIPPQK